MSATATKHRVTLRPQWVPDPRTSKLLGTRARRIVAWSAVCSCGWEFQNVSWSDARRFGAVHRIAQID